MMIVDKAVKKLLMMGDPNRLRSCVADEDIRGLAAELLRY